MTTAAYFDCFSGVAGDMVLGALLDAGVPLEVIERPLAKMPIESFELDVQRVERRGVAATHVRVRGEPSGLVRNYFSVRSVIEDADLPDRARRVALDAYRRLAEAEATVHGKDVGHVPFHELGAADTIVDIVGSAIGLDHLGVERVFASAVATGMGMMKTEHGIYPIPGPAVVELLKGAPLYSRGVPTELVTPTGAALLAATVERWGDIPEIRVTRVGYGAGSRELEVPNVLRVMIGEITEGGNVYGPVAAVLLETNIDDMNPELYEYVVERLLEAGAHDAWVQPIVMKRGRPASTLSVLCSLAEEEALREVIFRETTTLGIRRRSVEKWTLPRDIVAVDLAGGTVRVKVARGPSGVAGVYPEYADCARVARETGRPIKEIFTDAQVAARASLDDA